jgi:outer membrane protein
MLHRTTLALAALLCPLALVAQSPTLSAPSGQAYTLTLDQALTTAKANNPLYREALNAAAPAKWGVTSAWGNLFPSFGLSGGLSYTGSGQANLGQGVTVSQPISAQTGSSYSAGFQYLLNGSTVLAPGQSKANQRAVTETIHEQENLLRADITSQYLEVKRTAAQVTVARRQVERNQQFLDLTNARYRVGQGTLLEVKQAEVSLGLARVDVLRQTQLANEAKLEMFRRMGVKPPAPLDQIALADSFPVVQPVWQLDSLLTLAEAQNPSLKSLKAREDVASYSVKTARSEFYPSLSAGAGWSGYTQQYTNSGLLVSNSLSSAQGTAANCNFQNDVILGLTYGPSGIPGQPNGGLISDCNAYAGLNASGTALDPAIEQQILDQNSKWPFQFTTQPFQASLTISWPIFQGFSRALRVSQAKEQQLNANEQLRARDLQLQADVTGRFLGLNSAYEAIGVQKANMDAAQEQLRLAQDRYRLGSGNALEIADAQNGLQQAEGQYVNAIFVYHEAIVALEAAVGHPLR